MIFGKDKKNFFFHSEKQPAGKISVEDAAIDRWRVFDKKVDEEAKTLLTESDDVGQQEEPSEQFNSEQVNFDRDEATIELSEIVPSDSNSERSVPQHFEGQEPESTLKSDDSYVPYTHSIEPQGSLQSSVLSLDQVIEDIEPSESIYETQVELPRIPPADLSISIEEDLLNRFGPDLKSALGEGTVVHGLFSFESPVRISGTLTGEIKSSSTLIVGENATVEAKIEVGSLIVLGTVIGNVRARDLIEIRSHGSVRGDVLTNRLALEEGGDFNGRCEIQ